MTIYIDSDYICHTENADGRTAVETNAFDGMSKAFIEGYRYVPQGQTWTRADGVVFHGLMVCPAKDYNRIMTDVAISYLDDDEAVSVTVLFEEWQSGVTYAVGDRRQYDGKLYKVRQAHTSQAQYTPDITPALYELIDVEHKGTIDDPIPFDLGMAIENGKYYTQNNVKYLCIRDSINPLYNDLADLVGIYVEVVNE